MSEPTLPADTSTRPPMAVTSSGPRRSVARRVASVLAGVLGTVFFTAGYVAAITGFLALLLAVLGLGLTMMASGEGEDPGSVGDLWSTFGPRALWAIGIGLVVLQAGLLLVRGRRRLVLFLRRFGHSEATHAATVATRHIGRSWRLITLDDARITPVGVGAASRSFLRTAKVFQAIGTVVVPIGRLLGKLVFYTAIASAWGLALTAAATALYTDGDFGVRFETTFSLLDITEPVGGPPGEWFRRCAYVLLGCGALFLGWSALTLGFALVVSPYLVVLGQVVDAVLMAESVKRFRIDGLADIVQARLVARMLSRRVIAPRLAVMTVDSRVWQLAVGGLAAVSAVPLVDVSHPTENILWEVEQMTRRFGRRCVFIADRDRVGELTGPAEPGSVAARQQELLRGHRVLTYTNDESGIKAFARALRATLEAAARQPRPRTRPPDPITWEMMGQARREHIRKMRALHRARR
ncbi:hypothetical protein ACQPZF_16175 [Actinosynnema sp. CS-041913]|uniref:hypothetical protein n=1 Tax=Actinosynnema sp. CS-041913 TaxID=3239917 RepID=UPI003D8DB003